MDKKQLLEQNLNIFLENYIADLLHYYGKNNEQLATLLAQKKELAAQLKNQTHFLEYEELENAILHIVAELFYQDGFSDATKKKKKL